MPSFLFCLFAVCFEFSDVLDVVNCFSAAGVLLEYAAFVYFRIN